MTDPETVVRAAYAAYNAGNLEEMVRLVSPTVEWSDPDNQLVRGQADLLAHLKWGATACPAAQITLDTFAVAGDRVAAEGEYRGEHVGILNLPDGTQVQPTGRTVHFRLASVSEVHDGVIMAQRLYWDNFDVYSQMGMLAADGGSLAAEVNA